MASMERTERTEPGGSRRGRMSRGAALGAALLCALSLGAAPVRAEPVCKRRAHAPSTYLRAKAGDLVEVELGDLHATQAVIGYLEIYYKLGRYQAGKDAINKRFDDWCEANGQEKASWADGSSRLDDASSFGCTIAIGTETAASLAPMKTAVIGRGGRLFLVDGHHTFTSFIESPDGGPGTQVRVRVLANLSRMGPGAFWDEMEDSGWVWLRDENNQEISEHQLPQRLALRNFRHDVLRGLVYFTRDVAYTQNVGNANYQEFYWGAWLRSIGFDLADYATDDFASYLSAVNDAAHLISGLPADAPVEGGFSAAELGRIDYSAKEFTKLSVDYCQSKPGKVAYAMYYLHNILGVAPAIVCP